jgi:hypothetical protein
MLTKKNIRKARIASNRPLGKLKRLINPREREKERSWDSFHPSVVAYGFLLVCPVMG